MKTALLIWSIAVLFFLYEFFLRTFVGSIAHQIIPELHLSIEQFTLVGTAYYIAYGTMQIPVGMLTDKFGVKAVMVFAALTCAVATFVFAHSTGFVSAALGRFFMGLGSAFAFVCLLIIVSSWFPRRFFGFFAGFSQFIGTMGPVLAGGPLIAYLADSHNSWRSVLYAVSVFGVVLALLSLLYVKNKSRTDRTILRPLNHKDTAKTKLLRLLKTKQAWVVASYSATVYVSIALMAAVWGTEYMQSRGLTQENAAFMLSVAWIAYALGCPILGMLSDVIKRRKPILVLCSALGLICICFIVYGQLQIWEYELAFAGLGLAATGQNVGFVAITEHTDSGIRATALGLNNGMITLAGGTLPLVVGWFISRAAHGNATHLTSADFEYGLSALPVVLFVSLLISLFLFKETFCKPQCSEFPFKVSFKQFAMPLRALV